MATLALEDLLKASGRRMSADLSQRLVQHPAELGTEREEIIRQFLRAYLPKRFDVSTGFAFDCHGCVSHQLDIIIADSLACPRFDSAGGHRFFPCESIVAVGQVKSSLTTRDEFRKSLENLESAKSLDRSGDGSAIDTTFMETLNHREYHLHQLFSFVFITGKSLAPTTLHQELLDYVLSTEPHLWPNVIFALDKYLATFCCDDGVCPNPMDARGVALQLATVDSELLMKFYLLLGRAIEVTRVSGLPYSQYLGKSNSWSADVWYSTADVPPPYLSSIAKEQ